jgi:hypothetical protein
MNEIGRICLRWMDTNVGMHLHGSSSVLDQPLFNRMHHLSRGQFQSHNIGLASSVVSFEWTVMETLLCAELFCICN